MRAPRGLRVVRLRVVGLALAALLVGGLSAAGCGATRSGAGAADGSCVTALPTAFAVVHRHATLIELRRLTGANPAGPARPLTPAQRLRRARRKSFLHRLLGTHPASVCLAVFRGSFPPGSVAGARGGGRYALVLILANPLRVLHVAVVQSWPPWRTPDRGATPGAASPPVTGG